MSQSRAVVWIVALLLWSIARVSAQEPATTTPGAPGSISALDRERALGILDNVTKGIRDNYYDANLNGVDWDKVIAAARVKIAESNSLNAALAQVAVAVNRLNDSHTIFQPPYHPIKIDYGVEYQVVWSRCFVTRVRPGSDAAAKGLKPGTEILSIDGIAPKRQNLWNLAYLIYHLDPRPEMALELQPPSGEKQSLQIKGNITQSSDVVNRWGGGVRNDLIRESENERHRMRMQLEQFGDVGVLKIPEFFYDADTIYNLGEKIRNDKALIIDLRGNTGGSVETLKYLLGMFFDKDLKMCDRVGRKKTSPEIIKHEHHIYFPGKLIVLVDSGSASASEVFARVIQLEKRGTVIGDISSGYVMEAENFGFFSSGVDYGAEITVANLIMSDGKSLEHHGVKPDEMLVPQPADLESGRDPVLAQAAEELGVAITPEVAGKLFPYEWPK